MISLLWLLGLTQARLEPQTFIFSAQRYEDHFGKLYSLGPTHLFSIRTDGTGLKQLTSGNEHDTYPSLSKDGRHAHFWRGEEWPDGAEGVYGAVHQMEMNLDGSNVTSLKSWSNGAPPVDAGPGIVSYTASGHNLVLLNAKGKRVSRVSIAKLAEDEGDWLFDNDNVNPHWTAVFSLGDSSTLVLQNRVISSDGGYDFLYRVDVKRRSAEYLGRHTMQAVSADGLTFVTTKYGWVGGYRGIGAEKNMKMFVWDAKRLSHRPIGFRYMACFGACFVPTQGGRA